MAQGSALRSSYSADAYLALEDQVFLEPLLDGRFDRFDRVDALEEGQNVPGRALDHVVGELEVSVAIQMSAGQVTHQQQRADAGDGTDKGQSHFGQQFDRSADVVEELLAGDLSKELVPDGLAADYHVQYRLDADGTR